LKYSLDRKRNL